jgi:hypothetical protein
MMKCGEKKDNIGFPWDDKCAIQRAFFRTGTSTHLFIEYNDDDRNLRWVFTFRDIGMFHTIEKNFRVVRRGLGTWRIDDCHYPYSTKEMLSHVFDHYFKYVEKLYMDFGIGMSMCTTT